MKYINVFAVFVVGAYVFLACSSGDSASSTKQSQYIALHEAFIKQDSNNQDYLALTQRALNSGYKLIDAKTLQAQRDEFIIISTLPLGIHSMALIEGAKHFAFARSMSLNKDGSDWNWKEDALSESREKFLALLGEDKNAKIVFYDDGLDIFAPFGSAHTGILWAKHFGYKNLYRLVGGFGTWKDLGLPITNKLPECCSVDESKGGKEGVDSKRGHKKSIQ